ncbi:MFS transporter [Amycolatopsis taiwanensis]|uniref:MFS transporter n=1 Tax=Amycolatopsis taiwanensis TaxID=342230 RepID=UPI0004896ADC|nr:MFS transporter [Amycolatopsis taiwanensis]
MRRLANRPAAEGPTWYYVLIVVAIALVTENANFEFTLVSVGLPDIAAEFQTKQVALTMTVVFVASLVFLPVAGKLADVHGKKKVLIGAAILFAIGSVICALAPFFWLFLLGRVMQSAFVIAYVTGYGLIRDLFPPRLVPLGVGALGVGTGVSAFAGPLLGGYLVENYGFRSAFWFVFGYDVIVTTLVLLVVPETRVRAKHRIDVLGGVLLGLAMAILVLGVVQRQTLAYAIPLCVVLLALFVLLERRRAEPLVDVGLVRQPKVWLTLLAAGAGIFVSTANSSVLAPQLLRTPRVPGVAEHGLGLSALDYGVYYGLWFGLVGAVAGYVAGWVSRRFAPRTTLLIAIIGSMAGVIFILAGQPSNHVMIGLIAAFMGVGLGFFYAGANNLIIEAVPTNAQGVTTSLLYTALGVMNSVCTAVAGAIMAAYSVPVGSGKTITSDTGYQVAYLVLLGVSVLALALTLAMRHGRRPASGGAAPDRAAPTTDKHQPATS